MVRNVEKSTVYTFEGFRLDVAKRLVYGLDGKPIPLKAKAFDTLLFLVENPSRVVEREELSNAIWPGAFVEENNLTQHISSLRRMFGEKPDDHRFIATVPGHGYMFVAKVRTDAVESQVRRGEPSPPSRKWFVVLATSVVSLLLVLGFVYYKTEPAKDRSIRSIAVLPFKPLPGENRDESLEWGMTNVLINKLNGAEGLDVFPLSSVLRFASPDQNATDAGKELNADVVLDSRIQSSGDRVRVTVTLIKVAESKPLWVTEFEEKFTDIFAVQEKIAERVAAQFNATLGERARKRFTNNAEAYRLYWEGRSNQLKLNPNFVKIAIEDYLKAIDLDPNYALAWAGISDSQRGLILSAEISPIEPGKRAIEAADKAIELDPQLAEAHAARANAYFWLEHDWINAEAEFKQSIELDPKSAVTHANYAHMLSNVGRHGEAITEIGIARQHDPNLAIWMTYDGIVHQQAEHFDIAFARFNDAKSMDRELWLPHLFEAEAYTHLQRYDAALESARRASAINPLQTISTAYECVALAGLNRRGEAKKLLDGLLQRSTETHVPHYHLAIAYMGLGDRKNALDFLEKSFAEQDVKIVFLKADHIWDDLRSEPRFIELMTKMNFN